VTQDVFLFLLQRGRSFDPERGVVAAYLFGVARNYVRRAMEKSHTEAMMTTPAEDDDPELVTNFDPVGDIARSQTSAAVRKAVLSLPEHYREAVVLCDLQELSLCRCSRGAGMRDRDDSFATASGARDAGEEVAELSPGASRVLG